MRHVITVPALAQNALDALRSRGFFPSTLTLQQMLTEEPNSVGQQNKVDWQTVPGYGSIPCAVASERPKYPVQSSIEVKTAAEVMSIDTLFVMLDGYFPNISKIWRAVVVDVIAGVTVSTIYDIRGIGHDSHRTITWIRVELHRV